ncbi:MAG TPA: outer membrane protein transport protein [bacterium]
MNAQIFKSHRLWVLDGIFLLSVSFVPVYAVAQSRPPIVPLNLSYLRINFIQPATRQAALGGAFIGAAQDVTAAAINPAGLAYLRSVEATMHQRLGHYEFDVNAGSRSNPGAQKTVTDHNFDQTFASVFLPLRRVSIALFHQAALDTHYDFETPQFLSRDSDGSAAFTLGGLGNYAGRKVNFDLELVQDAWSVAFAISKNLSVGAAFRVSSLSFKLDEQIFLDPLVQDGQEPRPNSQETLYAVNTLNERNNRLSYSFGLMNNMLLDRLFLGAVVNLNPTYELQGNIYFPPYQLGQNRLEAATSPQPFKLSIPDSYGLGVYYLINSRLRFSFDLVHIEYSDLLSVENLDVAPGGNARDLTVADATEVHAGLEWLFKVPEFGFTVPMRFGVYTNPGHQIHAAGNDIDLNNLYPAAGDRLHFSFGVGATVKSKIKLDTTMVVSASGYEFWGSTQLSVPVDY